MGSENPPGGQTGRGKRSRKRGSADGVRSQAEAGLLRSFPKTSCWKIHTRDPCRVPFPFPISLLGTTFVFPIHPRLCHNCLASSHQTMRSLEIHVWCAVC